NCVYALAVSGNDLYAAGQFTTAGGSAANYIAKWNGSSWTALGSGTAGGTYPFVYALAVSSSDLYAGGNFTMAGGKLSAFLARAVLNHPPLAVANVSPLLAASSTDTNLFILSPNNAAAAVVLDGSQSSDAENDLLEFFWY